MARELIEPNLHVVLIHTPLALLAIGTAIEFFAPLFWRRSVFRAAGRWMILLGALSLVPVAASGLYAMAQLNNPTETEAPWVDVRAASPIQGHAWELMKDHARFNVAGSIVLLLVVVIWLASSDRIRYGLHLVFLILLVGGVGTLIVGAWHGGEMVYHHGVGVNTAAGDEVTKSNDFKGWRTIENYVSPEEIHVILGGAAIAAGLAAIGVSLRAGANAQVTVAPTPELSDIGYAFTPGTRPIGSHMAAAQLHAMDDAAMRFQVARQPVGRFWLLAAVLAIGTLLVGWWSLAAMTEMWRPKDLWDFVWQNAQQKEYRRVAHVGMGGGIVVLMLLLALVARSGRRRIVVGFFSLLLLGAVAAQGWLGGLMLVDTASGSVWRLNSSAAEKPTTMPATAPTNVPATIPTTGVTTPVTLGTPKAPAQGPG